MEDHHSCYTVCTCVRKILQETQCFLSDTFINILLFLICVAHACFVMDWKTILIMTHSHSLSPPHHSVSQSLFYPHFSSYSLSLSLSLTLCRQNTGRLGCQGAFLLSPWHSHFPIIYTSAGSVTLLSAPPAPVCVEHCLSPLSRWAPTMTTPVVSPCFCCNLLSQDKWWMDK